MNLNAKTYNIEFSALSFPYFKIPPTYTYMGSWMTESIYVCTMVFFSHIWMLAYYLFHSQSSMDPILSMDLALAVASFKVLQVMRWVDYLNSFEIFIFHIIPNQAKA